MNNIFSIVILYNPNQDNINNLSKISRLSNRLYVIDNSDEMTDLNILENDNIIYIKNDNNIGLSRALNIGIKKCLEDRNCTHIALFDQDSTPDQMMIQNLMAYLEKCADNVVAVSPQIVDIKNNRKLPTHKVENVDRIITSGSLYPRISFEKVGLMDETFFIDYIDYEWCLRAKSKHYEIIRFNEAILFHNMGDKSLNFFGLQKPLHTNHIRSFFIIRNQLIFISRNYIPLAYKISHFFKLFYRIPAYIFFSKRKSITIKFIIKAFFDFYKNKKNYSRITY
jgi:rhamnosyltransferase